MLIMQATGPISCATAIFGPLTLMDVPAIQGSNLGMLEKAV
jgi:hypothetical protein